MRDNQHGVTIDPVWDGILEASGNYKKEEEKEEEQEKQQQLKTYK